MLITEVRHEEKNVLVSGVPFILVWFVSYCHSESFPHSYLYFVFVATIHFHSHVPIVTFTWVLSFGLSFLFLLVLCCCSCIPVDALFLLLPFLRYRAYAHTHTHTRYSICWAETSPVTFTIPCKRRKEAIQQVGEFREVLVLGTPRTMCAFPHMRCSTALFLQPLYQNRFEKRRTTELKWGKYGKLCSLQFWNDFS